MAYEYETPPKQRLAEGIDASRIVILVVALVAVGVLIWLTHTPVTMHGLLLAGEIVLAGLAVMGTAMYKSRAQGDEIVPATVIFNVTVFVVGGLTIVSIATFHSGKDWAASMMWSLACLALGSAVGFLFGIPRSRVPGTSAHAAAAAAAGDVSTVQPASSETALEQISDWLTKIIVGVGLTNLGKMPDLLKQWAWFIGLSLDPTGGSKNFAMGLIFFFCLLGLVSGYLLTQMFLLGFVNRMGPTPEVDAVLTDVNGPVTPPNGSTPPILNFNSGANTQAPAQGSGSLGTVTTRAQDSVAVVAPVIVPPAPAVIDLPPAKAAPATIVSTAPVEPVVTFPTAPIEAASPIAEVQPAEVRVAVIPTSTEAAFEAASSPIEPIVEVPPAPPVGVTAAPVDAVADPAPTAPEPEVVATEPLPLEDQHIS